MIVSKRKYYCSLIIVMFIMGVLLFVSTPIANKFLWQIPIIDAICKYGLLITVFLFAVWLIGGLVRYGDIKKIHLLESVEDNLISVGAYVKRENIVYAELPKIRIRENSIVIKLPNLKIRTIIERYLDSFSTALPDRYIVEDYYISQNNAEVVILYEDTKTYQAEKYTLSEYKTKIESLDTLEVYFDKKHILNVREYPHFLISGSTGSGKSYCANQMVIQAIIKGWNVVVCDLKRSYGLYSAYTDYCYEIDEIMEKLLYVESEMKKRMQKLQFALDKNPNTLAVDIGYKPMLVVLEEYISLQSSLDKKQREELERVVKNISVLARQANVHLMIVMQSAGTENINATIRSNLTKVLLGNAQSNILSATFGTGVDIPNVGALHKGEGLIGLDRITLLRVPEITDIEDFHVIFDGAAGRP